VMSYKDKQGFTPVEKARNCGLQFLAEQYEQELEQRRFNEHLLLQIGLHLSYGDNGVALLNEHAIQLVMEEFNKLN
jgi:hypothetical protein